MWRYGNIVFVSHFELVFHKGVVLNPFPKLPSAFTEVVSYLTPFTGLRPGDLDSQNALSIDRARRELQELLPRRGKRIFGDFTPRI